MHERPGRVIAQAVVEDAGDDVEFFRAGLVHVEPQEPGSRIDFQQLRLRSIGAAPERAPTHARVDLLRRDLARLHMDDIVHGLDLPIMAGCIVSPIPSPGESDKRRNACTSSTSPT
jgi:hypothetical protein